MLIPLPESKDGNQRWINPEHVTVAIVSVDELPPGTFNAYVELRTLQKDAFIPVELGGHPTAAAAHAAAREFLVDLR